MDILESEGLTNSASNNELFANPTSKPKQIQSAQQDPTGLKPLEFLRLYDEEFPLNPSGWN